jgi:energy-coupling factor transporter ATP-binding protein EcfA2
MSDNEAIAKLVGTLSGFKPGGALKNYIAHAVFPKFKNFEPGTRIDFSFPLTALVGANGIGKSSLLHALWGMPYGYSTSKFWFATELDPIEGNQKDPQRYFYGHWSEAFGGLVETRKARVGQKKGVDYWEPARRSGPDGMAELADGDFEGKSKDRWKLHTQRCLCIGRRLGCMIVTGIERLQHDVLRYFARQVGDVLSQPRQVLHLRVCLRGLMAGVVFAAGNVQHRLHAQLLLQQGGQVLVFGRRDLLGVAERVYLALVAVKKDEHPITRQHRTGTEMHKDRLGPTRSYAHLQGRRVAFVQALCSTQDDQFSQRVLDENTVHVLGRLPQPSKRGRR